MRRSILLEPVLFLLLFLGQEFKAKTAFDGIGVDPELRDAVVDIFLGIQLNYNRGSNKVNESFPFQKTIFTRKAAVYSDNN